MRHSLLFLICLLALATPRTTRAQEHQHDMGTTPAPHAFLTHPAGAMSMLRSDVSVAGLGIQQHYVASLDGELAVSRLFSLQAATQYNYLHTGILGDESGIGDVSLGAKVAPVRVRNLLTVSTGASLDFPTGNRLVGFGRGHEAFAPFLLATVRPGPGSPWALQAMGHYHVSLKKIQGHSHGTVALPMRHWGYMGSAALSWTSPGGFSPMIETEGEREMGYPTYWYVAPGFRWALGRGWDAGASVKIPVRYFRDQFQLTAGLIRAL